MYVARKVLQTFLYKYNHRKIAYISGVIYSRSAAVIVIL